MAIREQEGFVIVLDVVYNGRQFVGETGGRLHRPPASNVVPTANREAMSANIIAAIRRENQLRGNQKFTALEIGHRMNSSGYGHVAYQMMAHATGYSRRTAIRHMHKLVAMGIFAKTVYRLANGYAINLYKCLLSPPAYYRSAPVTTHGVSVSSILPTPKTDTEKNLSLREEIRRLEKGMHFLEPGGIPYEASREKLQRLQEMLYE